MSTCQQCGCALPPPPKHQGVARKWCSVRCQSKARRCAHVKLHSLPCRGCGQSLPTQRPRGSLSRFHPECRVVHRTWYRLGQFAERRERYHLLMKAGAFPATARYGSESPARFEGTMAALREGA